MNGDIFLLNACVKNEDQRNNAGPQKHRTFKDYKRTNPEWDLIIKLATGKFFTEYLVTL